MGAGVRSAWTNLRKRIITTLCSWTAHRNPDHFRAVKLNLRRPKARDAAVYSLSVKANKVINTTCKNVHYDKHVGIVDITAEATKDFFRRRHPDKYQAFEEQMKEHDYDVFTDFEDFFCGMEYLLPYQTLLKVIKTNTIAGAEDKSHLAHFVVWQNLRSHAIMNAMLELGSNADMHKLESLMESRMGVIKYRNDGSYNYAACDVGVEAFPCRSRYVSSLGFGDFAEAWQPHGCLVPTPSARDRSDGSSGRGLSAQESD